MKTLDESRELRKLWGGFWQSRVLLTANNLRVFDLLESPQKAEAAAKALQADKRAVEILLDALTGIGLLKKSSGAYKNTAISSRFLVEGSPYYHGDIIRHADTLWKNWSGLDDIVRTGKPNRSARDQESFIKGMHNLASLKSKEVMRAVSLKGVKKALDLGGGPGTYSIEMAGRGISVTLFDLPETIKIAKGIIKKSGFKNINFVSGDFISDSIKGDYDLIFISQVLHAYSAQDNMSLIKKCKKALNPGGRIAIQEFYIDKSKTSPAQSAMFSVNMLVNTAGGRCYPLQEMKEWLSGAGFKEIKDKLLDDTVLVTGRNSASSS